MKDNKEFIDGIYQKYDEYLKEEERKNMKKSDEKEKKAKETKKQDTIVTAEKKVTEAPKFTPVKNVRAKEFAKHGFFRRNFVKVLSAAAVFTIVLSGVFISKNMIGPNGEEVKVGKTTTLDKMSLNTVNDFETFYKIVKDNYKEDTTRKYTDIDIIEDTNAINSTDSFTPSSVNKATSESQSTTTNSTYGANSESKSSSSNDYSKTNIQVENVDEADIVKTNGNYIFYVKNNKVYIVDIKAPAEMKKVAEIDFTSEKFKPTELYINNNKLLLIGNESGYSYPTGGIVRETSNAIYKRGIYRQKAVVVVYDITNIEKPNEIRRVEIEGNYVSSRMIGNDIYFVANKTIYGRDIVNYPIEDLDEDLVKPMYKDTIDSTSEKLIDFNRIYYFDNINTINYLTLGGFSLNNNQEADIKTFLGAGEDIYCSEQNMYIAKAKNVYDAYSHMSYGQDTKILKFNLNNGKINFKAEANVEGGINNQFSMDEHNGYFRIATTIGKTYNMDESTSNSLYVLDENLKEVGRIDGLAKAEKIYSVRYVGDRAYVVTFKEIDPLFVIDLSNPKAPKVLGELKIPGYSTYLHPYDENHVIGFGYDTKANYSNTGVVNDGLKMSMFDITDLSNPKEMFTTKIGDNRTSSQLTNNHKALLFSKEKNLIAFPISSYENRQTRYKAQVYDIDLNKGFTLRGEIEHKIENLISSASYNYRFNYYNIDRILYSNNVFYTVSQAMIKASDMGTLQDISKLELNDTNKTIPTPMFYDTVE